MCVCLTVPSSPHVSFFSRQGIRAQLDLMEGSVTVTTTKLMKDPYAIIKARDVVKLICRGVPYQQAIKMLSDDNISSDIIKIGRLVTNRERFVRRRQRLIGSSGSTLKAIELLTDCYVLIQGNTVAAIGPYKGLAAVRKVVFDCLQNNIHPVFNIKRLMIQKELSKNPELADKPWDRFLPKLPKSETKRPTKVTEKQTIAATPKRDADGQESSEKPVRGKKRKSKVKKDYNPFPPEPTPSKIDLQLESGEYFLNQRKAPSGRYNMKIRKNNKN